MSNERKDWGSYGGRIGFTPDDDTRRELIKFKNKTNRPSLTNCVQHLVKVGLKQAEKQKAVS